MSIKGQTSSGITLDAWGRPKSITDKSLFSSKFTFDLPDFLWLPPEVTGDSTVESVNGSLVVTSGTSANDLAQLRSRRHTTYQPNRGHLYSTALMLPNADAVGAERRWGMYFQSDTYQTGVRFELVNGALYGTILTTVDGTPQSERVKLNVTPAEIEGGALFDIQFQWRGVGDYFFYVNQKLVGEIVNLEIDNDTHVTVINPSLPVQFQAINKGVQSQIICGCVDVTSEGGQDPFLRPLSIDTLMPVTVEDSGTPMLIVYVPIQYKGQHNTRDLRIIKASLGLFDTGAVKILVTRDTTAFGNVGFGDLDGETDFLWADANFSCVKYLKTGLLVDETKCKLVDSAFIAKAGDNVRISLSDRQEVTATHGDYIILYGQYDKTGTTTGYGSITLGEEI